MNITICDHCKNKITVANSIKPIISNLKITYNIEFKQQKTRPENNVYGQTDFILCEECLIKELQK